MDQQSKFLYIPPAVQWFETNTNRFISADIDGNSREEIIVFDADPYNPRLAILSHLQYSDIYSTWTDDGSYKVLVLWSASGVIPGDAPWPLNENNLFFGADIDGDSKDEIIALSTAPSPQLGILKWLESNDYQTNIAFYSLQTQSVFESIPLLTNVESQQFCVGRITSKEADELVAFAQVNGDEGSAFHLAVYGLQGSQIEVVTSASNSIGSWQFNSGDQIYCADLNGDGLDEIVIFHPGSASDPQSDPPHLGAFYWDNSSLQLWWDYTGSELGGWSFHYNDDFEFADFDADGQKEILIFGEGDPNNPSGNPPQLGAFRWNGDKLFLYEGQTNSGWQFTSTDQFYCANLDGAVINGHSQSGILAFKQGDPKNPDVYQPYLDAMKWNNDTSNLDIAWNYAACFPNQSWCFSYNDQFYCADLDGDGCDEIVMLKLGSAEDYYKTDPCYFGVASQTSSNSGPEANPVMVAESFIPAWGIDVLVNAPSTPLTQFQTEGEKWAYGYISNCFDRYCNYNIRGVYILASTSDNFSDYSNELQDGTIKMPPDAQCTQAEWQAVVDVLTPELAGVGNARAYFGTLTTYAGTLNTQQVTDLKHCKSIVQETVNLDSTSVSYWPGQVGTMMLWGMAAISITGIGCAINVILGMMASIFGSILSEPDANTATPVLITDLGDQIQQDYTASAETYSTDLLQVLNDEVKIQLFAWLAENTWAWVEGSQSVVSSNVINSDRIYFYQQLLPVIYTIAYFPNSVQAEPNKASVSWGSPGWSYWVDQANSQYGDNQVYLLYQATLKEICTGYKPNINYPSEDLSNDLFKTLQVPQEEFFKGQGIWVAIPRVTLFGDCPQPA